MVLALGGIAPAAQEASPESGQPVDANRIHITADTLITNTSEKNAEFVGNVKATQGTTVITSDRLQVFYRDTDRAKESNPTGEDVISRIVATGNVRIVFDNQVATTQRADYLADQRVVVLSGEDTTIVSGGNSISGTKITLYRDDGRIQVEGGQKKRVEAFFYTQENGLAPSEKNRKE